MPHNGADYEIFKHNIENSPKRSEFNLSYKNTFNCEMGLLRPFYIEETLPSDKFTISNSILARVSPMEVPLMSRIRIFTDYYYMKNEWIWNNWREFITKGRNGNYEVAKPMHTLNNDEILSIKENIKQNANAINNGVLSKTSLAAALEYPILNTNTTDSTPTAKRNYEFNLDTMPFFMYQKIYRDYYMNKNLNQNDKTWFPDIEDTFILGGGTDSQTIEGNGETLLPNTPKNQIWENEQNEILKNKYSLFAWRWANWRDDYFTTAMPWPQRGEAESLDANISQLQAETTVSTTLNRPTTNSILSIKEGNTLTPIYSNAGRIGYDNRDGDFSVKTGEINFSEYATATSTATTTIQPTGQLSITAENLRRLLAVQIWQERNARTDGDYNEMIKAHFGYNPKSQERRPIYIGGTVQEVVITEVLQTSETGTTPQGNASGHAISNSSGFVGTFEAPDFGWIMGIMYIVPEPTYCEGLPRRYTRETALEYYWDEFNGLGAQEILTQEIFTGEEEINKTVFGYQERYSEYKHRRNIVTGELADTDDVYFNSWTIKREFSQAPELNQEFVTTEKNISMDAFTIENETPFTIEVANIVKANRPIPYLSAPNNMGVN